MGVGGLEFLVGGVNANYIRSVVEDFIPLGNADAYRRIYRDIYYHQPTAGSAVDLLSTLPWSDFVLTGLPSADLLKQYAKSIENLKIKTLLPEMSIDYLVMGTFIGVLNFDAASKVFVSIAPQDVEYCTINPVGVYGEDPIIDLRLPPELMEMLDKSKKDPRYDSVKAKLPGFLINNVKKNGVIKLNPSNVLYLPRRTFSTSTVGVSCYRRLVGLYLLEKALMRGSIEASYRRQRGILHIEVGDSFDWQPTREELSTVTQMVINADLDPTGAVIATRSGVQFNEVRCLGGNTYVHTENGLIKIKDLVPHNPKKMIEGTMLPLDLQVKGMTGNFVLATHWHYQGVKPVNNYYTDSNIKLTCTEEHKFLTVGEYGQLESAKIKDIVKDNRWLCIDKAGLDYNEVGKDLELNLRFPDIKARFLTRTNTDITLPKRMTPQLAYIIGILISEGYINKRGAYVNNTDLELIAAYSEAILDTFGMETKIGEGSPIGEEVVILGRQQTRKKKIYQCRLHGVIVVDILKQLGLVNTAEVNNREKSPSYYKKVPWSIMQADRECKIAFLAAYIEGDGCIGKSPNKTSGTKTVDIRIASRSVYTLNSIKILLQSLGFLSNTCYEPRYELKLTRAEGSRLYNLMYKYLVLPYKKHHVKCDDVSMVRYGIPASVFVSVLKERKIKSAIGGVWFKNDEGSSVFVEGPVGNIFKHYTAVKEAICLRYERLDTGDYTKELSIIRQVSPKLYFNILKLASLKYKFEKVVKVTKAKDQPTYDLTINSDSAPLFLIAGGVVTHNSGSDFWKISDMNEFLNSSYLRALGLSESLLSAESSISTSEASISSFLESQRAYRDLVVRKVFTNRIFPAIAVSNSFLRTKAEERKEVAGSLNHNPVMIDGRYREVLASNGEKSYEVTCDGEIKSYQNEDLTQYYMPRIQWHKHLKPEGDRDYLDMLNGLEDKGLPIPLRMLAAAGGVSLTEVMTSLDEDVRIRQQVDKYFKARPKTPKEQADAAQAGGSGGGMGGGLGALASLVEPPGNFKKNRNFESIEMRDPDTGKVLSKKGRKVQEEKLIKKAALVLSNVARKENHKIKTDETIKPVGEGVYGVSES